MVEGPKWAEWFQQRFPWFKTRVFGPELTPEQEEDIAATQARRREEYAEFFRPLREAWDEQLDGMKRTWETFYAWLIDYPSQQMSRLGEGLSPLQQLFPTPQISDAFTPADPTMERFLNFVGLLARTETDAPLTAATKFELKNKGEFDTWIDKWDWANIESGETEHKASTKFDLKNQDVWDGYYKELQWVDGYHLVHIHTKYTYEGEGGGDKHLGGYAMHEGGYPPLGMPNILASEFVLSPHTTRTLESYLGRLDQSRQIRPTESKKRSDATSNLSWAYSVFQGLSD